MRYNSLLPMSTESPIHPRIRNEFDPAVQKYLLERGYHFQDMMPQPLGELIAELPIPVALVGFDIEGEIELAEELPDLNHVAFHPMHIEHLSGNPTHDQLYREVPSPHFLSIVPSVVETVQLFGRHMGLGRFLLPEDQIFHTRTKVGEHHACISFTALTEDPRSGRLRIVALPFGAPQSGLPTLEALAPLAA